MDILLLCKYIFTAMLMFSAIENPSSMDSCRYVREAVISYYIYYHYIYGTVVLHYCR